ncbi:MAG: hypothetical protein HYV09_18325 [Deltaproteobacteria bacterium]|nr:hypothetical protein [Deltaproteobacteria bacterium]
MTIPLRGLDSERARKILEHEALRRTDTLIPLSSDATLERFVASQPDETDADITLRMTTRRELRVRAIARRAVVATLVAALAILALGAARSPAPAVSPIAGEYRPVRRDVGVLSVPDAAGVPVFVDDARVGIAPGPFEVACGVRRVRIGGQGSTRMVDVPCDGRVQL